MSRGFRRSLFNCTCRMSFVDTFDCLIVIVSDRDVSPDRYRIPASDQPDAIIVHVMLLYK